MKPTTSSSTPSTAPEAVEGTAARRKPYQAPHLEAHGTIQEVVLGAGAGVFDPADVPTPYVGS